MRGVPNTVDAVGQGREGVAKYEGFSTARYVGGDGVTIQGM